MTKKDKIFSGILIVACAIVIIPILYYSFLSVPYADDFSWTTKTREYLDKYGNLFIAGLVFAGSTYMNFQGTFVGNFLCMFCAPMFRGGIIGLRIYNTMCLVLLFGALFYMILMFSRTVKGSFDSVLALTVYGGALFCLTNNYMNSEIYTWYTVMNMYVLPAAFMMIGAGCYLLYTGSQKRGWISAAIFGALAAGGAINLATLCCGIYLFVAVYGVVCLKKHREELFPFFITVVVTFVNVIAPGNYARYDLDGNKISIVEAFLSGYIHGIRQLVEASKNTPLIVVCAFVFLVICFRVNFDSVDFRFKAHPIVVALLFSICVGIVNLPYTYGAKRGLSSELFEGRAFFVQDLALYLLLMLWLFYLAGYISEKHPEFSAQRSHVILTIIFSFFYLAMFANLSGGKTLTTPYMISSIVDGSAHAYSDYQEEILGAIEGGDEVIYIYYDYNKAPAKDRFIQGLRLCDDENSEMFWINSAIANYFGKEKIYVVYPD